MTKYKINGETNPMQQVNACVGMIMENVEELRRGIEGTNFRREFIRLLRERLQELENKK